MPEYVQLYDDEPAEEAPSEEAAAQTQDEGTAASEEEAGAEPAGSKNTPKTEVHDDVAEARRLMAE